MLRGGLGIPCSMSRALCFIRLVITLLLTLRRSAHKWNIVKGVHLINPPLLLEHWFSVGFPVVRHPIVFNDLAYRQALLGVFKDQRLYRIYNAQLRHMNPGDPFRRHVTIGRC